MPKPASSALQSLRGTIDHLLAVPRDAGPDAELVRRFAEGFFRRSDEVYLLQRSADVLLQQWRDLYRWAAVRPPNEILVRVFVPEQSIHGYALPRTVVQTCVEDQRFLFTTVRMALDELGLTPLRAIHPILGIGRNEHGAIESVEPLPVGTSNHESVMHFELPAIHEVERLAEVEILVRGRLAQVQAVVGDWKAMVERATWCAGHLGEHLSADADFQAASIAQRYFHWLVDDHIVFQGFCEYERIGRQFVRTAELGVERFPHAEELDLVGLSAELQRRPLRLGKSGRDSSIHRQGKLDLLVVRLQAGEGRGERLLVWRGLYTARALNGDVGRIPILRERLDRVLVASAAIEGSHLWTGLQAAFRQLPVEFLLAGEDRAIERATRLVSEAEEAQETRTHLVLEPGGRAAFVVVAFPRDLYDEGLRERLADRLRQELGANYLDGRVAFGQSRNVVLHFYLTGAGPLVSLSQEDLSDAVADVTRTWEEAFLLILRENVEARRGDELAARYGDAFPEAHQISVRPEQAVTEVALLEAARESGDIQVALEQESGDPEGLWHLKVVHSQQLDLTTSAPILELFGLRLQDQRSIVVRPLEADPITLDTFRVRSGTGADLGPVRSALGEALCAAFSGLCPSDRLNQLVVSAGLRWREVEVLRLYVAYARQLGAPVPYDTVRRIWCHHPEAAAAVVDLFRSRFDPAHGAADGTERRALVATARERFLATLAKVEQAADDRVLRRTFGLIEATIRTNFWAGARLPGHPLSVKVDCEKVPEMPQPRPFREIFVHHEAIEGVHLRGGPVARGGLRWSDRPEDYRTEILGLMATQMVKNVLIVPVGAKGGFMLRHSYATWKEARAAADELYKVFIRGLLDVTDNVKEGAIVPPTAVVRYDADDPYLVVAADKGTAHLSNTANAISAEYGFWLGDAFASGGSQGYDHKLYAITAKGAWVCTRRHFREMGLDPERDPITAVGIGDMSGDVFGNGLLLSKTVRLLAAFDHRHIFLDPNPGPGERCWQERKRLFDLPGSCWNDYDRSLISDGGGVWPKNARSIPLSPQARTLLGTEAAELPGEAVVKAILGIEADLLWNGGIGTWVKASSETHRDAADSTNDAVRMDARDLRFKVVGEGGNLGFTQAGRVEFARRGGRINTDAMDNSGGVDMSDHEVNLKILFQDLERRGEITREERNACLVRMAGDVSQAVEADNYHHSLMISLDLLRSRRQLDEFRTVIHELERSGMDRARNAVPDDAELARRAQAGEGLSRPELCRVGPYVKMFVYDALRGDAGFLTPWMQRWLSEYFPGEVRARWNAAVLRHQLRVDIAATVVTNYLVDALGATHWSRLMRLSGRSPTDVAYGSLLALDLLDGWTLAEKIRDLPGASAEREYEALLAIYEQVGQVALWLLQRGIDVQQPEAVLARFQAGFAEVEANLDAALDRDDRAARQDALRALRTQGLWTEATARTTALPFLVEAGEAVLLAERFPGLGHGGAMALLRIAAAATGVKTVRNLTKPGDARDEWEARALAEVHAQVNETVAELVALSLEGLDNAEPAAARQRWVTFTKEKAASFQRVADLQRRIESGGARGLAPVVVLARAMADLRG